MKFKDYLESLNKIAKERPESLGYEVIECFDPIYATHRQVNEKSELCWFNDKNGSALFYIGNDNGDRNLNAICIN